MNTQLPIQVLDIEGDGFHLMIPAQINGVEVELLIDTGASRTVFDKSQIHALVENAQLTKDETTSTGLGTSEMIGEKTLLQEVKLGNISIEQYEASVLDLSHVNTTYQALGYEPIVGVLGSDLLMKYNAEVNYGTLTLTLST